MSFIETVTLFFFQAEDGIRDGHVTGVQTCALPISYHVNNSLRGGDADTVVTFGKVGEAVRVGDWGGNGSDTLGIRRPVDAANAGRRPPRVPTPEARGYAAGGHLTTRRLDAVAPRAIT